MESLITIRRATTADNHLIADIGKKSFIQSHGSSASQKDIDEYVTEKFNDEVIQHELQDPQNIYHLVYYNNEPAGFSKIIFDYPHPTIPLPHVAKLERIYLLENFLGTGTAKSLFAFNMELAKTNAQQGFWLYVWEKNTRAISFYKKHGFEIVGSYDFWISKTHSNPNHRMLVKF